MGKNMNVRPTSDKVMQGMFNILGPFIVDADFLDLFAGTGKVSKEALKRGANKVFLVENHKSALRKLRDDLCDINQDEVEIIGMDVRRALPRLAREGYAFDIIFADPPYNKGWLRVLLVNLSASLDKLLRKDGYLVVEHSSRELVPAMSGGLVLESTRRYGETCISFFKKNEVLD
ncbi:MAG: RsmD family RNA methyltransferase [Thermovirga sp.]|nr:RsmD family RNA methyltransferase [Thermovirga sp.]